MVRTLLASTAIATLVATGAFAQMAPTQPAPAQPGATMPAEQPMVKQAEGHLASNLIGESVYNGSGDDAENIGSVNDLVLGPDGQVEAIVVGVGGFLGIGEKNVALEYGLIEWVERDSDEWLVVETTQESLEALPEFDLAAFEFGPADQQVGETKPATKEDLAAAPAADGEATDDMAAAPVTTDAPATNDMAAAPAEDEAAPAADETAAAPAMTEEPATEDMAASDEATDETEMAQGEPADDAATTEETAQAPATEAPAVEETDDTQTAAIDRSTLNEVALDQIRTEDFVGTTVYGANEENVGEVGDVIMSADGGSVDAIIIDVGGFLGIGEKEVAVGLDNLNFMTDADGSYYLYTNMTQEQLEAQPAYDEAGYAENRDTMRMVVPN